MTDLQKLYSKVSRQFEMEVPEGMSLEPCMYCGEETVRLWAVISMYGWDGAWVRCKKCGACGPLGNIHALIIGEKSLSTPTTADSLEQGKRDAVQSWNTRQRCVSPQVGH